MILLSREINFYQAVHSEADAPCVQLLMVNFRIVFIIRTEDTICSWARRKVQAMSFGPLPCYHIRVGLSKRPVISLLPTDERMNIPGGPQAMGVTPVFSHATYVTLPY